MVEIRRCQAEDFDDVLLLLQQLWPGKVLDRSRLREVFHRALISDFQAYLCATDGQRVIGFGSLTIKNNLWQAGYLGHVDELVVDTAHRGHGIGTRLLEELIALARQCHRVELDSAFHRKEAHQFYERLGFENRAYLFSKEVEHRSSLQKEPVLKEISIIGVHHIQLTMPFGGEEAARGFYSGLLGIAEVPKPPAQAKRGGAWFENASVRVHLGVERDFRPAEKAHPGLLVRDLHLLVQRLRNAGFEVTDDEPLDGYEHVYVIDPFGNRLELLESH